jgi:kinesin family protein 1
VVIDPEEGAECFLNGQPILESTMMITGARLILGRNHVFRYNYPQEARQSRQNLSAIANGETIDWRFAQSELYRNQGIDLKQEMEKRVVELEQQYKRELEDIEREYRRSKNVQFYLLKTNY